MHRERGGGGRGRGSAVVETLVALPVILLTGLSVVQWARLYEVRASLDYAALMAARAGAVDHARVPAMRRAFAQALLPLYSPESTAQGLVQTLTAEVLPDVTAHARIRILNPTQEAFTDFGEPVDGELELPFANLHHRDTALGPASGVNLQDANLLRVQLTYGQPLEVPFVGWTLARTLEAVQAVSPFYDARELAMLEAGRLPVTVTATVRMQSRARLNDAMVSRGDVPSVDRVLATGEVGDPTDASPSPTDDTDGDPAPSDGGAEAPATPDGPDLGDPGETDSDATAVLEDIAGLGDAPPAPQAITEAALLDGFPGGGGDPGPGSGGGADLGAPAMCAVDGGGGAGSASGGLPGLGVGNPVNVATGNKYQRETDLAPLSGGALALRWRRHYNSRGAGRATTGLGHGWRHGYQARVVAADAVHLAIRQADGRRVRFTATETAGRYRGVRAGDGRVRVSERAVRWRLADGRVLVFDRHGRLARVVRGRTAVRLTRDARGRLEAITDARGRTLRLRRDPQGRITAVIGPAGERITYTYDARGNLTRVVQPDGATRRYHYDDDRHPFALTGISLGHNRPAEWGGPPALARFATYAYDDEGRATLTTHAHGVGELHLAYGAGVTRVTDGEGHTTTYHHRRRAGTAVVTRVDGPGCRPCGESDVAYTYDERLRVTAITRTDGPDTHYTYDEHGRLAAAWTATAAARGTSAADPAIRFAYAGDSDRLTRVARPSIKPGAARTLTVRYTATGRPAVIREAGYAPRAEGGYTAIDRTQRLAYDDAGRLVRIDGYREGDADITTLTWGGRGHLAAITYPDGVRLRILDRDDVGRPTRTQLGDHPALRLTYDVQGRVTEARNANGALRLTYDNAGNLTEVIGPGGERVDLQHDAARRLTALTGGGRTRYRALTQRPPPARALNARATAAALDPAVTATLQRAIAHYQPASMPGGAQRLRDALGRLTAVTDARGNTTRYGLDDFGRRVFRTSPDSGTTRYTLDGGDRLQAKTNALGDTATFTRDALGRLAAVELPDDRLRFEWQTDPLTGARRSVGVTSATSTARRRFDAAGRVLERTRTIDGARYTTGYTYDQAGRLASRRLPGGATLRYHYAGDGSEAPVTRVTLEGALWGQTPVIINRPPDREHPASAAWIAGNGVTTRRSYRAGRLAALTIEGLHEFTYHYDAAGRLTRVDDGGAIAERFRYDERGRLDFALTPAALFGYHFDANGNRTEAVINGAHTHVEHRATDNRLTRIRRGERAAPPWRRARPVEAAATPAPPPVSLGYDATGAVRRLGTLRLTRNANGQVTAVHKHGRLLARYSYNARAQRVVKLVYAADGQLTTTRHFLYDERDRLSAIADATGAVRRVFVRHRGRLAALLIDGAVFAVHTDHRGAPIAVTDAEQRVVWRAAYAPYGAARLNTDPDGDGTPFTLNLRLPGQYADAETGLYANHHRLYAPRLGRYLSVDPLGLAAGMNPYAYAANDPINHIDPTGLLLFAFDGTNNSDAKSSDLQTNVVQFRDAYRGDDGELDTGQSAEGEASHWYYISGVGTDDPYSDTDAAWFDGPAGNSLGDRVLTMADHLYAYLDKLEAAEQAGQLPPETLNLDIVGFSRGAAEARIFANLVDRFLAGDEEFLVVNGVTGNTVADFTSASAQRARDYLDGCTAPTVNLRFLGLWDTVSHLGVLRQDNDARESYGDSGDIYLGIPDSVGYTAQAVAANERRKAFSAWSIFDRPGQSAGDKTEKRFLGAHSDIGGGYRNSDLSDVAFMWMVQQAEEGGGLPDRLIDRAYISKEGFDEVEQPTANDPVFNMKWVPDSASGPGRQFRYLDEGEATDIEQDTVTTGTDGDGNEVLGSEQAVGFLEQDIYQDEVREVWRPSGLRRENVNDGFDDTGLQQVGTDGRNADGTINERYAYETWLQENYQLDIEIDQKEGDE